MLTRWCSPRGERFRKSTRCSGCTRWRCSRNCYAKKGYSSSNLNKSNHSPVEEGRESCKVLAKLVLPVVAVGMKEFSIVITPVAPKILTTTGQ